MSSGQMIELSFFNLLALSMHVREGYSSHPVCLSVCLSVCHAMILEITGN